MSRSFSARVHRSEPAQVRDLLELVANADPQQRVIPTTPRFCGSCRRAPAGLAGRTWCAPRPRSDDAVPGRCLSADQSTATGPTLLAFPARHLPTRPAPLLVGFDCLDDGCQLFLLWAAFDATHEVVSTPHEQRVQRVG